jgi:hypothetical protein
MRNVLAILCVFALLGAAATPLSAQDNEKVLGLGVDLENSGFSLIGFGGVIFAPSPFFSLTEGTQLTPCFMLTWRVTPAFFIEPSFGFHRMAYEEEDTVNNMISNFTLRDIKFGLGGMWVISPSDWCSPYVRGKFDIHLLNAKSENDVTFPTTGTNEEELSATAWVVAGSLGGIVNFKDCVFLTVEGRLMYGSMGDTDDTRTGPNWSPPNPAFTDDEDTSSSAFWMDMVVGLRILVF